VAAELCPLALGTQTIGSIIRPAAFCGVVGVKPTYDRISRDGVIPLSPSLDHVGYFAPDVSTARRVAPSIYEAWDHSARPLRRPILGIPDGPYLSSASDEGRVSFERACLALARAGYELRHVAVMADYQEIRARHDSIMSAEAAQVHAGWFEDYEDLYAPKTAELIRRGNTITQAQLMHALQAREVLRVEIQGIMQVNDLDVWVAPSAPGSAPRGLDSTGDPAMNLPWTQAGLPSINLPAGTNREGLPLGLQLIGRWSLDEALLAWAEELERVVGQL
jgi:Asp-tRNA(Asn)/Glu-tRNA(Gln) amidotransferase A subunit family amidase